MHVVIQSTGRTFEIDPEDFGRIFDYRWCEDRYGYVYCNKGLDKTTGKQKTIRLHRLIMDAAPGTVIDHRDGDRKNNRKYNLRFCSHTQNRVNKGKPRHSNPTSIYKGVLFKKDKKRTKPWFVSIRINKKARCVGYYKTEIEAAIAYDLAATEHYGEFANLNFPVNVKK